MQLANKKQAQELKNYFVIYDRTNLTKNQNYPKYFDNKKEALDTAISAPEAINLDVLTCVTQKRELYMIWQGRNRD